MAGARRKIVFFSHSPDLYGAERSLLLLLDGLDRDRFEMELICPGPGLLDKRASEIGLPVRRLSREGISPDRPLLGRASYFLGLRSLLRRSGPDLVYVNTVAHTAPIFAARSLGLPCMVHVRESESYFRYRSLLGKLRIHALVRFPDRFVAVSDATADLLRLSGVPRERITVVHNGVDPESYRPAAEVRSGARSSLGVAEDEVLVGFVGQLIPRKGGDIFLSAARTVCDAHPGARFLIVGGRAESEGRRSMEALCRELGLAGRVTFLEFQEEVRPFYDAMDIFVNCSRREPFARVNLEAMAMATPVVATDVGGNREAVMDGESGYLVQAEDAGGLGTRIADLVADPELRRSFGEAARRRVLERFTVAHYRSGVGAVIDDILEKRI
jgi:glycosyltransferase involved in cell wall biosynthesis